MTDEQKAELIQELKKIKWPILYGRVIVQIRAGKPTVMTTERTDRLD